MALARGLLAELFHRPESEKLAALRELRGEELPDGTDAREAIVGSMIDLVRTSADPSARADAWRQLHGVADPAMRDPLLYSLQNDPSASVRSEAAETLDHFISDPVVADALRNAGQRDADERVRKQAARSLARGLR